VDGITRITGYFTKVSSWNKGKIGELRNRYRNQAFFDGEEEGFSQASSSIEIANGQGQVPIEAKAISIVTG
jgi:hypothetical protein